jgi:uncharacterized membrane protein
MREMRKQDFLNRLRARIYVLPTREREERLNFYSEMIDDKMEEGLSEAEAVESIGSIDAIASQLLAEFDTADKGGRSIPKRRFENGQLVMLIVGAPLWIPLSIAAIAILFSLYVVLWAVIVTFWAVFASVTAVAPAAVVYGAVQAISVSVPTGFVMIGGGLFCAGLAILAFFGCLAATKGSWRLTRKTFLGIFGYFKRGGHV